MAWGQGAVTRPIMVDSTTLCPLCLCSSCIKLRPSHTLQPDNVVSSQLRQQLANWKGLRFAVSTKRWTTVISAPNCPFPPGGRSLSVFTCPHDPPLWYHVRFIFDPVCRLFLSVIGSPVSLYTDISLRFREDVDDDASLPDSDSTATDQREA